MNFICPPDLREAVAAQMKDAATAWRMVARGEPVELSKNVYVAPFIARRIRAAAALEVKDSQRHDRLIVLAKTLEMSKWA